MNEINIRQEAGERITDFIERITDLYINNGDAIVIGETNDGVSLVCDNSINQENLDRELLVQYSRKLAREDDKVASEVEDYDMSILDKLVEAAKVASGLSDYSYEELNATILEYDSLYEYYEKLYKIQNDEFTKKILDYKLKTEIFVKKERIEELEKSKENLEKIYDQEFKELEQLRIDLVAMEESARKSHDVLTDEAYIELYKKKIEFKNNIKLKEELIDKGDYKNRIQEFEDQIAEVKESIPSKKEMHEKISDMIQSTYKDIFINENGVAQYDKDKVAQFVDNLKAESEDYQFANKLKEKGLIENHPDKIRRDVIFLVANGASKAEIEEKMSVLVGLIKDQKIPTMLEPLEESKLNNTKKRLIKKKEDLENEISEKTYINEELIEKDVTEEARLKETIKKIDEKIKNSKESIEAKKIEDEIKAIVKKEKKTLKAKKELEKANIKEEAIIEINKALKELKLEREEKQKAIEGIKKANSLEMKFFEEAISIKKEAEEALELLQEKMATAEADERYIDKVEKEKDQLLLEKTTAKIEKIDNYIAESKDLDPSKLSNMFVNKEFYSGPELEPKKDEPKEATIKEVEEDIIEVVKIEDGSKKIIAKVKTLEFKEKALGAISKIGDTIKNKVESLKELKNDLINKYKDSKNNDDTKQDDIGGKAR